VARTKRGNYAAVTVLVHPKTVDADIAKRPLLWIEVRLELPRVDPRHSLWCCLQLHGFSVPRRRRRPGRDVGFDDAQQFADLPTAVHGVS
jgi:hypothetical protein